MCGALASQWPRRLRFHASPMASPLAVSRFANGLAACATALLPKAGQWLCQWQGAQPFCRARPVRAPLAGQCPAPGKRFAKKRAARGMARERDVLRTGPFPCRRHSSRAAQPLEGGIPMDRRHLGGVPVAWQAPQWPGSHWPALGLALRLARKRFCRARPCARTNGPPLARLRPVQGHKGLLPRQKARQKARPSAPKFFSTFFHKPPCALSADVVNLRQFKGQIRSTKGL